MRTLLVALTILLVTPPLGASVLIASLFRVPFRPGGIYERVARGWAKSVIWAAGVRVRVHGAERIAHDGSRVYVSNHASWFDIFALASSLPSYTFIAKRELAKVPIFGPACRAIGIIFIDRANRKAAFDSYAEAATDVRGGKNVVVCPEGTRGYDYRLRPFKKGPFVLAIAAGVPIVPTIVHGQIAIQPKGSMRIRSGAVDVHFLEPVETASYSYDQREALMQVVWQRMADALHVIYGVESTSGPLGADSDAPPIPSSFF
jgi:1-acyl-sn-glycerol-3-phosphate acyltransferase